jgi:hypothetical protein
MPDHAFTFFTSTLGILGTVYCYAKNVYLILWGMGYNWRIKDILLHLKTWGKEEMEKIIVTENGDFREHSCQGWR